MPQDPLQVDALQIEPSSGDTLTISRDSGDGSLLFIDALNTSGIKLSSLAGLQTLSEVYVVSSSGAGAEYTTIQAAIDAVPVTASATAPALILIGPGVYSESLLVEEDGIFMVGLGGVTITSSAAQTIDIKENVTTQPKRCVLQNLKVVNTAASGVCVKITGGSGSTVASERIDFLQCDLEASGVGGYQIDASACGKILVQGGSWDTSNATSLSRIQQVAEFDLQGTHGVKALQLDYDSGGAIPSVIGSAYKVSNLDTTGNIASTLSGDGSLEINHVGLAGTVTMNGDRTLTVRSSEIGALTLNNTSVAILKHSNRGTATGTGTLSESIFVDSQAFAASSSEIYSFPVAQPDSSYAVALEYEVASLAVTKSKGTAGFTIEFPGGPETTTVNFTVTRSL